MSSQDDSRFQDLYQRYYRSVVAFFVRLGFSRDDARDCAQDTFVRVYRGMGNYRGDAAWAFLQTTARRIAINEIRRRTTQMRKGKESPIDESLSQTAFAARDPWTGAPSPTPETSLVEQDEQDEEARRRVRLREAIASLSDSLKTCLLLRLQGRKYREIEKALDLSLDAVKSRLNEARNRLRARLGEDPGELAGPPERSAEDDHDQEV